MTLAYVPEKDFQAAPTHPILVQVTVKVSPQATKVIATMITEMQDLLRNGKVLIAPSEHSNLAVLLHDHFKQRFDKALKTLCFTELDSKTPVPIDSIVVPTYDALQVQALEDSLDAVKSGRATLTSVKLQYNDQRH